MPETEWTRYLKAHRGQGRTTAELARCYRERKMGGGPLSGLLGMFGLGAAPKPRIVVSKRRQTKKACSDAGTVLAQCRRPRVVKRK